jgi:hypothetical protein
MKPQLIGRLNRSDFFVAIFVFSLLTCVLPAAGQGVRVERSEQMVSQRQVGWEHVLTDRDPNLSHWHWEPITNSYRQVQMRTIYEPARQTAALSEQGSRIKSTAKLPNSAKAVVSNRSTCDLNGRVIKNTLNSSVAPPTVLTYGHTIKSKAASTQCTQTKVAGKVLRLQDSDI